MSPTLLAANNYYYPRGGSENVYFSEMALLEAAGWNVVPFSMHHPQNLASPWSEYFVEEIELGNIKSLAKKIRLAPKSIYSFEAKARIAELIDKVNPDVCHLHNIYHHLSPSFLSTVRKKGIPLVMTLHDLKLACPAYNMMTHDGVCERCKGGRYLNVVKNRCVNNSLMLSTLVYVETLLHDYLKSYADNVDRYVVPSKFYYNKLAEWGIAEQRLTYIPNAIDVAAFEPRQGVGDYFLYAGRLVPEKGVHALIDATARSGVRLKVVGTGPEEARLKSYAERKGADVEFTGFLSGTALQEAFKACRAFVLPSEWYENAPISVLEAFAYGVPTIGADIGGIPELISVDENGATFASGNVDELTDVLARFNAASTGALAEMGANARRYVERHHDNALHVEQLLGLYAELGVAGAASSGPV